MLKNKAYAIKIKKKLKEYPYLTSNPFPNSTLTPEITLSKTHLQDERQFEKCYVFI